MRCAGFLSIVVVCLLVMAGMIAGGCSDSDDDKGANPVAPTPLEGVWATVGNGEGLSFMGQASALTVYDGELIVAGFFSAVDSVDANTVASWNGTTWAPLGTGISGGPVRVLATFGSFLVAGGAFDHAGTAAVQNVALWDGDSWSSIGITRSTLVAALIEFQAHLFVGGDWGTNGGLQFYSGSSWITLSDDIFVSAFTVFDDDLIIGGSFSNLGDDSGDGIVAFNGLGLSSLGSGIMGNVNALIVYDGKVIAGGYFTSSGGVSVSNIAAWDGSNWTALGGGLNSGVLDLAVLGDKLIAVGQFMNAGGTSGDYAAGWDGSSWRSLGSGTNGIIEAVTVYDNKVVVAGDFTTAGGFNAHGIASWTPE